MGSSPVTATIPTSIMDLLQRLEDFFRPLAESGEGVVVAFSGGPDSTALLWGMAGIAPRLSLRLFAAHLDHALDAGSASRAAAAARLAARLGVPFVAARRGVLAGSGESGEAAARRARYAFLEEVRQDAGARRVATAHHRDDQAETVLLRLLFGSGLEGLAGIRPVSPGRGTVVRPLLGAPRAELAAAIPAELVPVDDPTNHDLAVPRNRVRHRLLPALDRGDRTDLTDPTDPGLASRLARLAGRARAAGAALDRRLASLLTLSPG